MYADDLPETERIIPVKDFDCTQYDCFIYDERTLGRDIQKVLSSYNIDIRQDMKAFLKLEVLPEEAVKELKLFLKKKNTTIHILKISPFANHMIMNMKEIKTESL